MKNLKFRLWDHASKEWVHGPGHEIHLLGETVICGEILRRPDDSRVPLDGLDKLEILPFTGQIDSNGVELYEGDIYEYSYKYDSDYDGDMPIVKSTSGRVIINTANDLQNLIMAKSEGGKGVCIGNIYENTELI